MNERGLGSLLEAKLEGSGVPESIWWRVTSHGNNRRFTPQCSVCKDRRSRNADERCGLPLDRVGLSRADFKRGAWPGMALHANGIYLDVLQQGSPRRARGAKRATRTAEFPRNRCAGKCSDLMYRLEPAFLPRSHDHGGVKIPLRGTAFSDAETGGQNRP